MDMRQLAQKDFVTVRRSTVRVLLLTASVLLPSVLHGLVHPSNSDRDGLVHELDLAYTSERLSLYDPLLANMKPDSPPRFVTYFNFENVDDILALGMRPHSIRQALIANEKLLRHHGGLYLVVTTQSKNFLSQLLDITALTLLEVPEIPSHCDGSSCKRLEILIELSKLRVPIVQQIVLMRPDLVILRNEFIRALRHGYSKVARFAVPMKVSDSNSTYTGLDTIIADLSVLREKKFADHVAQCSHDVYAEECFSRWLAHLEATDHSQLWSVVMSRHFVCSFDRWQPGCLSFVGDRMPSSVAETVNDTLLAVVPEEPPRNSMPLPPTQINYVTLFEIEKDDSKAERALEPLRCKARAISKMNLPFTIFTSEASYEALKSWNIEGAKIAVLNLKGLPCSMPGAAGRKLCRKIQVLQSPEFSELNEIVFLDVDTYILDERFFKGFDGWRNVAPFVAAESQGQMYESLCERENYHCGHEVVWYNSGVFYIRVDSLPNSFFDSISKCKRDDAGGDQTCISDYMNGVRRRDKDILDALLAPQYHCRLMGKKVLSHLRMPCMLWHKWGRIPAKLGHCM